MNRQYESVYGGHIKQYIGFKRKLGFKFNTGIVVLSQLDALASERGETSPGITKAFTGTWSQKRPNESDMNRYDRIRHLAQFSSYLCDLGIPSYIPRLPRHPNSTFTPYIFSSDEISALFDACDRTRMKAANRESNLIAMPALLRLLYATGIRMGEAAALKVGDVNLEEGHLLVRDSKNGKQRIIPLSPSLVSVCREYSRYRNLLPCAKKASGHFFIKLNGKKCGQSIRAWFKKCRELAGIPSSARLHDLRHTFAVTSLAHMAKSGVDLYASLPILSNYLGHQSIGATDHYVRMTASMYPDLVTAMEEVCIDVFPKFRNYEAD